MADWRAVAKAFALGDGHVSQKEVAVLRQMIFEDGHISKREMSFLHEIRDESKTHVKALDELIEECESSE